MRKLYETKPILFAVLWIVLYCAVMAPIRGRFGDDSVQMLLGLTAISTGLLLFIRANTLQGELGLDRWIRNGKKILWLIPIWILSTGNLWSGLGLKYTGINAVMATMSFLLVGFVEETVFRGFLFNGMRKTGSLTVAIIVSAVTFGMGHIVNLLSGQATVDTLLQIVFAVAWGFLLTYAYYTGGSLIACVLIHGIIDAASVFGRDNVVGDTVFMVATIVVAIVYCLYPPSSPRRSGWNKPKKEAPGGVSPRRASFCFSAYPMVTGIRLPLLDTSKCSPDTSALFHITSSQP